MCSVFLSHHKKHNQAINHSNNTFENFKKKIKTHPSTLQTHMMAPIGISNMTCKLKKRTPVNKFLAMGISYT